MLRAAFLIILLSLFGAFLPKAEAAVQNLCNIVIEAPAEKTIDFSETETDWLCGTDASPNWQQIPLNQKIAMLKNFLQARGYHEPEFKITARKLYVNTGKHATVKHFTVERAPPELHWKKRRRIKDKPLSPNTLDELENWTKRELQTIGYPCPNVSGLAVTDTESILINVDAGKTYHFGKITPEGVLDLPEDILERFTAFREGQPFDIRLLELSSRRILEQNLYTSSYYDIRCFPNDRLEVVRRFLPAKPRLLTIGAGFDTERGPIARARFQRVRIGHSANSWETVLLASLREQDFDSRFNWYFSPNLDSRLHLIPRISYERHNEKNFESLSYSLGTHLANGWEFENLQLTGEAGPAIERVHTIRGIGPDRENIVKVEGMLTATSHLFEYYTSSPRTGWSMALSTSSQIRKLFSNENIHRGQFTHHILWNLGDFDPPLLVFGWRSFLGSYFMDPNIVSADDIPVNERFFLGGSDDIRGFGRKELPRNNVGFLTALYEGFELRAGDWFDVPVQPLVFFDVAKGDVRNKHLQSPTYYAPGLGVRYDSPLGSVRSTLARGYTSDRSLPDSNPKFQFYFSFGKEF